MAQLHRQRAASLLAGAPNECTFGSSPGGRTVGSTATERPHDCPRSRRTAPQGGHGGPYPFDRAGTTGRTARVRSGKWTYRAGYAAPATRSTFPVHRSATSAASRPELPNDLRPLHRRRSRQISGRCHKRRRTLMERTPRRPRRAASHPPFAVLVAPSSTGGGSAQNVALRWARQWVRLAAAWKKCPVVSHRAIHRPTVGRLLAREPRPLIVRPLVRGGCVHCLVVVSSLSPLSVLLLSA